MGFASRGGLVGLAAIGLLAEQSTAGIPRKKPKMRTYPAPIGPPHPKSRQHLRALLRAQAKVKLP